jgi:dipeptidyl aminopeptidase/acylaminoacyl peptidase
MCDIDVIDLDASMNATGPPRRLATVAGVRRLDWSRDGRSIVYDDFIAFIIPSHLWRAGADGGAPPERIEVAGMAALGGGISWVRSRLAFSRLPYDVDIYKVERGRQPQAVALSSLADLQAAFSPDGRRIAFSSSRSGEALEIWVADSDGANPRQITHGPGRWQGSPHWSPDGRRVAFDSQGDDGHWHAWTVEVGSGSPRRVTNQPGDQTGATYSADGQWIYFAWDSGGGSDIWRTRAAGDGPVERMTTAGSGAIAFESPDGKSLVYQAQGIDAPLMTIPLSGGPARRLVSCVRWTAFAVSARGFYYVPCGPGIDPPVRLLDPTTGQDRVVGQLEQVEIFAPAMGLAVSPDGKTILYNRHISDGSDLMLIENFR